MPDSDMPGSAAPTEFTIDASLDGERADVAISRLLGVTRSVAADLIDARRVRRAGASVKRSSRLGEGEVVAVEPDLAPDRDSEALDEANASERGARAGHRSRGGGDSRSAESLARAERDLPTALVVKELTDDFVVVDKPAGMASHASPGWLGPTVGEALARVGVTVARSGPAEREGIVHRLDVGTSGLMVVARSELAYRSLKEAFKQRTVTKVYNALVQGHPDPSRGTIDAPIGRHPRHDGRYAVVASGKPSITQYEVTEAYAYASLVRIHLLTGRTHQIRVHMSAVRHPCCGDTMYGADWRLADRLGLTRQWLHASELEFDHPVTGKRLQFTSDFPADLSHALDVLAA